MRRCAFPSTGWGGGDSNRPNSSFKNSVAIPSSTNYRCNCHNCDCTCPCCICPVHGVAIEDANRQVYPGAGGCRTRLGASPSPSTLSTNTSGSFRQHNEMNTSSSRGAASNDRFNRNLRSISPADLQRVRALDTVRYTEDQGECAYDHDPHSHYLEQEEIDDHTRRSIISGICPATSSRCVSPCTTAVTSTVMSSDRSNRSLPSVTASDWLRGVEGNSATVFEGDGYLRQPTSFLSLSPRYGHGFPGRH